MRQFILGGNVAYTAATTVLAVANGAVGIFYDDNGVLKVTATGNEVKGKASLVLGRPATSGGPVILPIHKNNFTYVKGTYTPGVAFTATFTITAPTSIGEHSIIVAKKGVKFNERNKWTASVYVKDTAMTAANLATALTASINANGVNSGVTATVNAATITITGTKKGDDYAILGADGLSNVKATVTAVGVPAYGDAKYIIDLANKAAADAGFEYTYQDDVPALYPNYPLDPLAQPNAADNGFTIFTLRFAEPRDVKTRDEVVNQIVQVAFPTGASAIASFETVVKSLAGIVEEPAG